MMRIDVPLPDGYVSRGGIIGMRLGRVPIQLVHHTGAAVVMVPQRPSGETSRSVGLDAL